MPSQWFIARAGRRKGPYSSAQLTQFAKLGQLLPTDQLWKKGMQQWVSAARFPQLFPAEPPKQAAAESAVVGQDQEPVVVVQPASSSHRRKKRRSLSGLFPTLAVLGVGLASSYYVLSERLPGLPAITFPGSGRPVIKPQPESDFFKEVLLKQRSPAEQEKMRKKARQITLGMTEDEVVEILGSKWDGYVDAPRKSRLLCWDTGGLGIVVWATPHEYEGELLDSREVSFVSEGNSGYFLGNPPPE